MRPYQKFNPVSLQLYFKVERRRKWMASLLTIATLFSISYSIISNPEVTTATTKTLTSDEFKAGVYNYNQINYKSDNSIALQSGALGSWNNEAATIQSFPETAYYPEMAYGLNNTLYTLVGNKTGVFKRYWLEEKRWETLATLPFANFTKLVFDGSRYYYTIANAGFNFYRYDSYTDYWEKLPETPNELYTGSIIEYAQTGGLPYIYTFRGGNTGFFWRYNITTALWEELPSSSYTVSTGSSMVWDKGNYLYLQRGVGNYRLYRYDLVNKVWTARLSNSTIFYDWYKTSMIALNSNEILVFRGSSGMYKYTVSNEAVTTLSTPRSWDYSSRAVAFDGSSKVYVAQSDWPTMPSMSIYDTGLNLWDAESKPGGGFRSQFTTNSYLNEYTATAYDGVEWMYVIRGGQAEFYKVSMLTGVIVGLAPMTGVMQISTFPRMIVASNGRIYVTRGGGYNNLYSYNIAQSKWEWNAADPPLSILPDSPASLYEGTDLVDGGDGWLYIIRGYSGTTMYRLSLTTNLFDPDFGGTGVVSRTLPGSVYYGGGAVKVGNEIVVLAGYSNNAYSSIQTGRIFRYNLTTKVATEDPIAPMAIGLYAYPRLTTNGVDKLYVMLGMTAPQTDLETSRRLYDYNLTSKVWTRLADAPNYARGYGSRASLYYYKDGSNVETLYALLGGTDNRIWRYNPSTAGYATSGTYYSKRFDLVQSTTLNTLQYAVSGTGSATFYTRSSDNLATWSTWTALSGNQIVNDPGGKRYFQFKIVLTGNGSETPVVSNIALNYAQETNAPSQPDLVMAFSEAGGTRLNTGSGYVYHHPYFTWNAADDGLGGSGVAGYYVYFGDSSSADPQVVGSYQTATSYTGAIPMSFEGSKVYYLRLRVKDKLGNISTAVTHFSYIYQFVSPPGSATVDTQTDFGLGVATGVDISDLTGKVTLNKINTGTWSDGDLAKMPQVFSGGGAAYAKGSVYVVMGNASKYFYRFDLSANQWVRMADTTEDVPASVDGSVLCYDGSDYIYFILGNSSLSFYKYRISTNVWFKLQDLPVTASAATAMAQYAPNKYIISLMSSTVNFLYDSLTDTFEENAPAPGNFTTASNFYTKGDGVIYTVQEDNWLRKFVVADNRWYTIAQAPARLMDGQNIGFDGIGDNLYFFLVYNSNNEVAYKYSISENRFSVLATPNMEMWNTGYVVSDRDRYVYIFHNNRDHRRDNIFTKYDTVEDRYLPDTYNPLRAYTLNRPNTGPNSGAESSDPFRTDDYSSYTYDGTDRVYIKTTGYKIIEYSISERKLIREFSNVYASYGSILYQNGYLYMTASQGNRFFRLDLFTQEWKELATSPGNIYTSYSQNLWQDKEGRIYALANNNTKVFYMYTPGAGTWTTLPVAPFNAYYGSQLVYDGSRYFYCVFGRSTTSFRRFDTSTLTWDATTFASLPAIADYGSGAVLRQNKIYITKGGYTLTTYIYDLALNTWSTGQNLPTEAYYGAGLIKITDDYALYYPSYSKTAVWRYNFPSLTNGNNSHGVYQFKTFSVDGIFSYVNLKADVELPTNTAIVLQTRSSAVGGYDEDDWSAWQDVHSVQINDAKTHMIAQISSTVQQNLQVRAILNSYDSFSRPTLTKLDFNYYSDTTPPNNPTLAKVYTDLGLGTELDTTKWQNLTTPVLDWPEPGAMGGATDGLIGSNIAKYYAYFGPDQTAVPESAGVEVTTTQYQPTLTTPGLYYLRIQAVDGSNNVATEVYAPLVYKFDNEKPANPSKIVVDPSGYTRTNDFSFSWDTASDLFSGVSEYCWRIGGDPAGPFATERCQSGTTISHIAAGSTDLNQQGANLIYIRSKDAAGNYSESTTEASFYYFSGGAPSAPNNLAVSPASSITNSFSFSWDPPSDYVGNVDKLTYYYSINEIPSATNSVEIQARSLGPIPAATQLGSNVLYLVAKDEAGNINWTSRASISFDAATTAPGVPLNLEVNDISNRVSGKWSGALSWDAPINDAGRTDHYNIYRSSDGVRFAKLATSDTPYYVDSGLEEGKTYYYQVSAVDSIGKEGTKNPSASTGMKLIPLGAFYTPPELVALTPGEDLGVEGLPTVPNQTQEARPLLLQVGSNTATLVWRTDRVASGFVLFGRGGETSDSKGSLDLVSTHIVNLTGLKPDSIYSYKIQNFDQARKYSMDASILPTVYTFKTLPLPSINDVTVTDITLDTATIHFSAVGLKQFQIQYGLTETYGLFKTGTPEASTSTDYQVVLSQLANTTDYNFRIIINTENGDELRSDNYTFRTVDYPKLSNIRVQPLESNNGYTVSWDSNVVTTTIISYQVNADILEQKVDELSLKHSIEVTGLASGMEYVLIPKGKDAYGNMVIGESQRLRTGMDTKPPTISNMRVEATLNSNNQTSQLVVSWDTDETSTSQVEFGKLESGRESEYPSSSLQDNQFTKKHVVIISGVELASTYHVRAVSLDLSGNVARSEDNLAVVGRPEKSVVQKVMEVIASLFGWLN